MITIDEFVERVCRIGADRGPRRFPRKARDREIMMKSILMLMNSAETYSEGQVNELLQAWKRDVAPAIGTDHVTIRRSMIDYGHLERTADGSRYRVGFPPGPMVFDLEIDELDIRATVAAFMERNRPAPPG
jgi:hypothetical protein